MNEIGLIEFTRVLAFQSDPMYAIPVLSGDTGMQKYWNTIGESTTFIWAKIPGFWEELQTCSIMWVCLQRGVWVHWILFYSAILRWGVKELLWKWPCKFFPWSIFTTQFCSFTWCQYHHCGFKTEPATPLKEWNIGQGCERPHGAGEGVQFLVFSV